MREKVDEKGRKEREKGRVRAGGEGGRMEASILTMLILNDT